MQTIITLIGQPMFYLMLVNISTIILILVGFSRLKEPKRYQYAMYGLFILILSALSISMLTYLLSELESFKKPIISQSELQQPFVILNLILNNTLYLINIFFAAVGSYFVIKSIEMRNKPNL